MSLINYEINLDLIWSEVCVIFSATGETEFAVADTKFYVPVVTLSTQDHVKLLKQLELGYERKINWNKYQSKVAIERQNQFLDYLIDPNFQGVNRLFVLSFENKDDREAHTGYFFPKIEIKDTMI